MKKLSFLLAALLIGGMMFTGCKKEDPKPTPDPVSKTAKVVYKSTRFLILELTDKWLRLTMLPCLGVLLKSLSRFLSLPKLKAMPPTMKQIFPIQWFMAASIAFLQMELISNIREASILLPRKALFTLWLKILMN